MVDSRTNREIEIRRSGESILPLTRWAIPALLCVLACGLAAHPSDAGCPAEAAARSSINEAPVQSVDSVGMTVSDVDRSVDFYSRVLSFAKISDVELAGSAFEHLEGVFGLRMRVVRMRLGTEVIELTEYLAPKGRLVPADSRSNDRWFQHIAIVTSDMDRAYAWLRQNKVPQLSAGPQTLPEYIKPAAGIRAFYFQDPDSHPLEILQFPADKGAERWHHTASTLFLGVDHTAIVVGDTEASLRFYRDVLGFTVAGESENYGAEQEHLNNVFGARLHITSLRVAAGPGIELLEYLAPQGGRAAFVDEQANDLVHHQTRLLAPDIQALARQLAGAQVPFVSSGIVSIPKAELGFHAGMLVRDPDGHPMELVEK